MGLRTTHSSRESSKAGSAQHFCNHATLIHDGCLQEHLDVQTTLAGAPWRFTPTELRSLAACRVESVWSSPRYSSSPHTSARLPTGPSEDDLADHSCDMTTYCERFP